MPTYWIGVLAWAGHFQGGLREGKQTYVGHDVLAEVGVCVAPRGAVGDHVVGAGGSEFGYHQGRCGGGHDHGAVKAQGARRVDGGQSCITAAGGEDVRRRAWGEFGEAAEDVVADSSAA